MLGGAGVDDLDGDGALGGRGRADVGASLGGVGGGGAEGG